MIISLSLSQYSQYRLFYLFYFILERVGEERGEIESEKERKR